MRKLNHKGFAGIETVLIAIILVVIGGSGYLVYKATQKTSDTYQAANLETQSPTFRKKKTAASGTKYLTISQWGVRAPYSSTLTLTYKLDSPNTASMSSVELNKLDPDCVGRGGWIARYTGNEVPNATWNIETQTAAQYFASIPKKDYAHIGDYYYYFIHDQAACGADPSKTESLHSATNDLVQKVAPLLVAIP